MPDPKDDSRYQETGFPSLQWEDDDLPTRPLPLHEHPLQARIDSECEVIDQFHPRAAFSCLPVARAARSPSASKAGLPVTASACSNRPCSMKNGRTAPCKTQIQPA